MSNALDFQFRFDKISLNICQVYDKFFFQHFQLIVQFIRISILTSALLEYFRQPAVIHSFNIYPVVSIYGFIDFFEKFAVIFLFYLLNNFGNMLSEYIKIAIVPNIGSRLIQNFSTCRIG